MGNATSCAPSIISRSSNGTVKVLFSDGSLRVYTKLIKAGELMLENPGQFVCHSSSLQVGQRILGLSTEEDLELRQFYFLLPMELLYSVLTDEEMSTIADKASRALKNKHGNSNNFGRIFPMLSELCMFLSSEAANTTATLDSSSTESYNSAEPVVERYSKQRSWKPALETIVEN